MRTSIVYIPGLGSRYNGVRKFVLGFWAIYGVSTTLVSLDWNDGGSFEGKMSKVQDALNQAGQRSRVVVIGESAGATLALHAASSADVYRVITLCGVTQPSTPISPYLQKMSPALLESTRSIPNTANNDVHSIRAAIDPVVGKKYSTATGAKSHTIWAIGHFVTILLCLTILSPLMVTIAKMSKM
mgnify:CR=1 FL=1